MSQKSFGFTFESNLSGNQISEQKKKSCPTTEDRKRRRSKKKNSWLLKTALFLSLLLIPNSLFFSSLSPSLSSFPLSLPLPLSLSPKTREQSHTISPDSRSTEVEEIEDFLLKARVIGVIVLVIRFTTCKEVSQHRLSQKYTSYRVRLSG